MGLRFAGKKIRNRAPFATEVRISLWSRGVRYALHRPPTEEKRAMRVYEGLPRPYAPAVSALERPADAALPAAAGRRAEEIYSKRS